MAAAAADAAGTTATTVELPFSLQSTSLQMLAHQAHAQQALTSFVLSSALPPSLFDDLVASVATQFGVKHAELSITTDEAVWLKAVVGGVAGVSRDPEDALCAMVARDKKPMVITDAAADPRVSEHPRVVAPNGLRFYAGVPLISSAGVVLGALCVWDEVTVSPTEDDLAVLERTARHAMALIEQRKALLDLEQERSVLAATGELLAMIVGGAELPMVLQTLVRAVEAAMPHTLASVLLLDGHVLRHGAAPSLPLGYLAAIEGAAIGPLAGSCGTAAHTGTTVIVSDIQTDPRWVDYRDLALAHGLRACWSVPIVAPDGGVLGTFALYYRDVRSPSVTELHQLDRWMNLAEVAITRARDISDLRTAATRDPLTGLTNRVEALRRLQAATATAQRTGSMIGVLFIDLDQFKFVNDTLGHLVGDEFLKTVANRLLDSARSIDTVARFGGDEFLVLCPDLSDGSEAEVLAKAVVTALQTPMSIGGRTLSLSASIGVAYFNGSEPDASPDPIGDADLAMYAAKRAGRNSVAVFTPDLRENAVERLSLEAELNLAVANAELSCVYQPTIDLQTGAVVAVEALLRWHSPQRGEVSPLQFIPVAEDSGLIGDLGKFVLRQACAQLRRWRQESATWKSIRMWVNVTIRQLSHDEFPAMVQEVLAEFDLDPDCLGLEVTESAFVSEVPVAIAALLTLRLAGVHVAIDDFGTGYSSLSQLKNLPVDALKIDQQFIADMVSEHGDTKIVEAIMVLARSLEMMVIAEGVEHASQRQLLQRMGCRFAQGHLWSSPLTPDGMAELTETLSRQAVRPVLPGQTGPNMLGSATRLPGPAGPSPYIAATRKH